MQQCKEYHIRKGKGGLAAFPDSRRLRGFIVQLAVLSVLIIGLNWIIGNTVANLRDAGIASGFDFLHKRAGFPLSVSFIPYDMDASFGRALLAGFVNTLVMSLLCIVAATILGLLIGLGRLSRNWLVRNLCLCYVEIFRNLPPLLVILLWYFGIFQEILPNVSNSMHLPLDIVINKRGFYFPYPIITSGQYAPFVALIAGLLLSTLTAWFIAYRQNKTGIRARGWPLYILFLIVLPFIVTLFFTHFSGFEIPKRQGFNFTGGVSITPEMVTLFIALSCYAAALISETIRAGVSGVNSSLKEAGASLGLKPRLIIRLITLPLAMRIIIPPLSSQYMNIIKNTSLAGAIAYPDLMSVSNSIIEKTNQSLEVVVIWLVVYLGLSLIVSVLMNWFNQKMALKER